ncbi:MAG: hypothetical protein HY318_18405 [Armatimonadetes bacterium]|nr:hypothetical protein [Armatimonadota bacterium]
MKDCTRWLVALGLVGAMGLSTLTRAYAGSEGRRNTAIVLGAAALYELTKGKTTNALVIGAGTWYAYDRYKDAKDDEANRNASGRNRFNFSRIEDGDSRALAARNAR